MNADIKAKWVAALRSGTYSQTTGTLKDSGGYCCLGVLCDVVDSTAWGRHGWARPGDEIDSDHELTSAFGQEIGLPSTRESDLITMNDEEGKSFAEIADYIEQNL